VRRAIVGNGFGLDTGLVGAVRRLEETDRALTEKLVATELRLDKTERQWDRLKWTVIGAAAVGGIGGGAIVTGVVKVITAATGGG
jgi:hypothetical protein